VKLIAFCAFVGTARRGINRKMKRHNERGEIRLSTPFIIANGGMLIYLGLISSGILRVKKKFFAWEQMSKAISSQIAIFNSKKGWS